MKKFAEMIKEFLYAFSTLRLGEKILVAAVITFFCYEPYVFLSDWKYHFTNTLKVTSYWIILISGVFVLNWVSDFNGDKKIN